MMFFPIKKNTLDEKEEDLIQQLADISFKSYTDLKNHPYFFDYLVHASPLRFYSETNIGSRPAKTRQLQRLTLKDLRAIPFVGAWSQLKQNVTGYYGVGTALQKMEEEGKFPAVKKLYKNLCFLKH